MIEQRWFHSESYHLFDLYEGLRLKKDISPLHIPSYSVQKTERLRMLT